MRKLRACTNAHATTRVWSVRRMATAAEGTRRGRSSSSGGGGDDDDDDDDDEKSRMARATLGRRTTATRTICTRCQCERASLCCLRCKRCETGPQDARVSQQQVEAATAQDDEMKSRKRRKGLGAKMGASSKRAGCCCCSCCYHRCCINATTTSSGSSSSNQVKYSLKLKPVLPVSVVIVVVVAACCALAASGEQESSQAAEQQRSSASENVILLQQQASSSSSLIDAKKVVGAPAAMQLPPPPPQSGAHIAFMKKFAVLGNSTSERRQRVGGPLVASSHYSNAMLKYQHQVRLQQLHRQHTGLSIVAAQAPAPASLLDKICIGTSNGLSAHNESDHYQQLAKRYQNCTYVIGNLEITRLSRRELAGDLSFLESIREITGYLLIAHVDVDEISMPNLQVIRGRDLFKFEQNNEEFAMILVDNELCHLKLPNLREILAGSVGSYNNRKLCHIRSIDWDEILNWPTYRSVFVYDGTEPNCPACHSSCQDSCWAAGADMCQKFSKKSCSRACANGRCFGLSHNECCHPYCAGGCTGPNQTDCLACKNFYDDGTCIQECPPMNRYNPIKFVWEPNPRGKYAFGATCVSECPENMLRDSGACVRTCPPNKRSFSGECVPCPGACPKNCQGVELVHSGNIDQLINCTVIEGSLTILDESFSGYTERAASGAANGSAAPVAVDKHQQANGSVWHGPMHPSRLEVFKTLREITGYLNIRAKHADFKDLSYFTNLKTIGGRQTTDMFHALSIARTSLVSLNLRSLRNVRTGKITIEENPKLCFADTIDWRQINIRHSEDVTIRNNAEAAQCRQHGLHCNEQCARDGCWGPGPDECLSCNNYKVDDYCVQNCSATEPLLGFLSYEDEPGGQARTCRRCHAECRDGCTGTGADQCKRCRNVKDGPFCVPECPSHKYNNSGTCEDCSHSCGSDSCTGPSSRLGEGGCNSCAKAVIKPASARAPAASLALAASELAAAASQPPPSHFEVECISADESCPAGYYQEYVIGHSAQFQFEGLKSAARGRPVCRKCHHLCKRCVGMGTHTSVCECAKYVAGEQCEDYCSRDYYADEESRQCVKCSRECNGCFGPTEADCLSCRFYRIYYEDATGAANLHQLQLEPAAAADLAGSNSSAQARLRFNCTAQCPSDKPHRISELNMLDPYCSDDPAGFHHDHIESSLVVSLGSSSLLLMLLVVSGALMVCLSVHRFQREKDKKFKLTMHLSGIEDVEPLAPSHMKPNLAPLRSIKETELRKGRQLGSGFGGTVYQGFWYPEGREQRRPRPVAIKVLRDNGQSNMNKEFLDEAYIMASVNHANLVRLLAVCMTPTHLMLVTQLMPHGCLLDYVKKNRRDIGSKNLLEWGKQIARGMAYLEENRMVHRDLALRNVLLQRPGHALISDFGLAKFLEKDQSEYQSGEGRLPIKWLAPECFRKRKFTHKSDVWAFGVTVWELVTFGLRPFDEYETKDVPLAIDKGARLQQPRHVSAELYKVMYACWFYNPDERPSFKQLTQSFVNFARDPERFIICGTKGMQLCNVEHLERPSLVGYDDDEDEDETNSNNNNNDDDDDDDDDDDEEMDDDDFVGHSADEDAADETANANNSPTSTSNSFSQQATPTTLTHQPNLTPSTHNRINEIFGFELRRHHQRSSESSSSQSNEQAILKKLAEGELFVQQQQQQHLLDHQHNRAQHAQHVHHQHQQRATIGRDRKVIQNALLDTNNNSPLVADANRLQSVNRPKNSVTSCWSIHHTISSTSLGQRSEQPTDVYDYLLPSPCTDEHGNAFANFYSSANFDQNSKTMPRNMGTNRTQIMGANNPPLSAGIIQANVTNEEYFLTSANYVNNQVSAAAATGEYHQTSQQIHHDHLSQRLSTSSGNIPQSLV